MKELPFLLPKTYSQDIHLLQHQDASIRSSIKGGKMRILSIFGTRPEAIKMAPVINLLEKTDGIESRVCTTGQHREMLHGVLKVFNVRAYHNLNIMNIMSIE